MLGVEAVPLVALTSAGPRPKVDYCMTGVPYYLFDPLQDRDRWSTVIHHFSFSKSYCIPGHRLGAMWRPKSFSITFSPFLLVY